MSIWSKLKKKIKSVVNNVSSNVSNAVNNVTSKVQNWFNTVKQKISGNTSNTDSTTAATQTDLNNQTTDATKTTPAQDNASADKNIQQVSTAVQPNPTPAPVEQQPAVTPAVETPTEEQKKIEETPAVQTPPEAQPAQPTAPETPDESTMGQVNNPEQSTEAPATNDDKFLAWYKSQFGEDYNGDFSKKEGMSDQDYETGNNLYQAYLQKQNLDKQLDSANEALDNSKAQQRQEASILRDKMAKYLQQQNKNNGLDNLGVSESVGLQADAQYMNNLGQIESDINSRKTDLLNQYMNNKTDIETETAANEQNILNKYQQLAREDEQKEYDRQQDEYNKKKYEEELAYQKEQDAYQRQQDELNKQKQAQDTAYNEFMSIVESGAFNSVGELEQFYNSYKDKLNPDQQAIAEQQINFYKNNPDQQEMEKAVEEKKAEEEKEKALYTPKYYQNAGLDGKANSANDDEGDNFKIKVNGKSYKVEKGKDASDNLAKKLTDNFRESNGASPSVGNVMIYGDKVYMYLENNNRNIYTWCVVQARKNTYAGDFKDMCNAFGIATYSRGYKDAE